MRSKLLLLCFIPAFIFSDPWGKDSDIAFCGPCEKTEDASGCHPGIQVSTALIRFHQEVVSPIDGPRSHYRPSSSQYTKEAIVKYGFFQGWILGCDRLMRENDERWVYGTIIDENGCPTKYDPIP